jgi:hypothetical protein
MPNAGGLGVGAVDKKYHQVGNCLLLRERVCACLSIDQFVARLHAVPCAPYNIDNTIETILVDHHDESIPFYATLQGIVRHVPQKN